MSRRRFLRLAVLLAVGGGAVGAIDLARAGPAKPRPSPVGSPALAAASGGAHAGPDASTAPGAPIERQSFRSRPDLTPPVVTVTTALDGLEPGLIFLTPSNGDGPDSAMVIDDHGALVWMADETGKAVADLHVARFEGAPVMTWWEGANNAGIGSGEFVVVDASYRELARIRAADGRQADLHELQLTSRGTALLFADASVAPRRLIGRSLAATPAPWPIMDCAVQEVDLATGSLVFEWHGSDHIDIDESYIAAPTTGGAIYDYIHGNSIEEDTDGDLIVSARNTSAIYKIGRVSGEIIWRLGGKRSDFAMGPGTTFAYQHDARRQPDGTLTVFDDGASPTGTRAIRLRLDEVAMTATLVAEYRQPQGLLATSQGNMQVLPGGGVFVGWGSLPRWSEYATDGRLLLDATFTATQSYRDYRFPWVGRPTDAPAIAVDRAGDAVTIYASWNGATEVATWEVLVGSSDGDLRVVASSPRSGFETGIAIRASESVVAVRALDGTGAVLGMSSTATTG